MIAVRLHCQILGNPTGQPLVFLHGWLGSSDDWLPVTQEFCDNYSVLLIDLPGHGGNRDPADDYDLPQVAGAVVETIREQTNAKPTLIGYSLGGRVALQCTLDYPDAFRALVLEGANPGLRSEAEREQRRKLDDQRAGRLIDIGLEAFLREWYRGDLFASLAADPQRLEKLIEARARGNPLALAASLRNLSVGRQQPVWDRLDEIALPVLLVAGELDRKFVAISRELETGLPCAELAIVGSAGHNTHLEQPQAFAETLLRFLRWVEQSVD
jgi:2-succinyl-6-hydroxy-2,4-cyclohexadiene-1-carboxylate synthase